MKIFQFLAIITALYAIFSDRNTGKLFFFFLSVIAVVISLMMEIIK